MSNLASSDRLKLSNFKLNALLSMAQAISADMKSEEIIDRFRTILNDDLGIDRILLYKREGKNWELLLNSNCPTSVIEGIDVNKDLAQYEEITFVGVSDNPLLLELDIIIPIEQNNSIVGYVLIGDTKEYEKGVSSIIRHLNFVQTLSIIIFVAIENLRLFHKTLEQEAMRKEMELASKMQSMLIPSQGSMPKFPEIDISSYYKPHFEVGGDYYDVIPLSDKEFGFCIADVSGKGMSAALLMSNFQANLRALFTKNIKLTILIEKLNERVMATAKGEKFITLFVGRYNFQKRFLEFINAGHNPPILYNKVNHQIVQLQSGCVGLGMLDEIPVMNLGSILISQPTKLICYTDGLVECLKGDSVEYNTKIIEDHINNDSPIAQNIEQIAKARGVDRENNQIFDDISILGFDFR